MSSDPHGHDKEPIILTSGRRMGKGLVIVAVTLAIGAAILIPFFDAMFLNPPPVALIPAPQPPAEGEEQPPQAGVTTIAILQGASTQGAPDYDPDPAEIPLGNKIVWDNKDSVPHTATSGTGPEDPESAALFDTELVMGGEKSPEITLEEVGEGDAIDYYCTLHPYMKAQLTMVAADAGGAPAAGGNGAATGGPTINILEGSSTQGAPDYDPDPLEVAKGDVITVVNQDTTLHTVTNGASPGDSTAGTLFDTEFMDPDATAEIDTSTLDPAEYDYFCQVHPYMVGKLTVTE